MFHRVKSETPSEPKQQEQENSQKFGWKAAAEEDEIEMEENSAEAEDETSEYEAAQPSAPQYAEKDANTMTEETNKPVVQQPESMKTRPQMPVGSYARSSQAAVRPAGYPGAYPGVSYSNPAASAAASSSQEQRQDRTLTIGAGITMSGEIESCDNLIVEGTVEAALKGARNLDIAESGTFYGTVEIEEAVIAGRFEGELNVTGRLTLRSGGVITGTIAYGELEIEAGAIIDGRLTPFVASQMEESAPKAAKSAAPAAAAAKAKLKDARPVAVANSDVDGELFAAKV